MSYSRYMEDLRRRVREYARQLQRNEIDSEETEEGMHVSLPERMGYKRIKKRFRYTGTRYYQFVPEPIFDNDTQFKSWNPVFDEWDVHPYHVNEPTSNVNAIFEDLKTKLWYFEGDPSKWYRNIRYNQNYWNQRKELNPLN